MLGIILISVAVVVVVLVIIISLQPTDFAITRSATIAAPAANVFAQVNDFHNWQAWSPWAKLDPAARNSFDGAPAGTGAVFAWDGNKKVGAGRMRIDQSQPNELIRMTINFLRPFKATNQTEFTFKPAGDGTTIAWTMTGKKNFMSKAFCLFANMDKMVGGDFEKGLVAIKGVVEGK
jgi:uncharacterized protein YndB with AHSA1/START domain